MSRRTELLEGVMNQLIDEEALGVCFEMHRAIKLGYYELLYPEESVYDKQPIVDVKGLDIFGNAPFSVKKSVDCTCPNCNRFLGAQKFAPHLEKCMGMGRNSTRLAAIKKPKVMVESEHDEGSEDNEEDWTYPETRKTAGQKRPRTKDKTFTASSSPHKGGRGPGRPSKQQLKGVKESGNDSQERERDSMLAENGRNVEGHSQGGGGADFHSLKPSQQMHTVQSFKSLPAEHKVGLLDHICGVVSERTGRLCTRSVNCPQHSEDQRSELRMSLLTSKEKRSLEETALSSPHKKTKLSRKDTPDLSDDDNSFKSSRNNHNHHHHESSTPKKSKSSKRNRHGNSSHTTATVLHSSSSLY